MHPTASSDRSSACRTTRLPPHQGRRLQQQDALATFLASSFAWSSFARYNLPNPPTTESGAATHF
eukprot:scaffold194_cov277-Pinguiococcus_pyrenoidosus.AAC.7